MHAVPIQFPGCSVCPFERATTCPTQAGPWLLWGDTPRGAEAWGCQVAGVRLPSAVGLHKGGVKATSDAVTACGQGISHVYVRKGEVGEVYLSPKQVMICDLPGPGGRTFGAQYHDYSKSRHGRPARGRKSRAGTADKRGERDKGMLQAGSAARVGLARLG
jgi:hypothetical protein